MEKQTSQRVQQVFVTILCTLIVFNLFGEENKSLDGAVQPGEKIQSDTECYAIDRSRPEWLKETIPSALPDEGEEALLLPKEFALEQNYPNPFNPETTIRFAVKEKCLVVLKVFDVLGREVQTLVEQEQNPGYYNVPFFAENLPSGLYLFRIQMLDFVSVKKMVVLE